MYGCGLAKLSIYLPSKVAISEAADQLSSDDMAMRLQNIKAQLFSAMIVKSYFNTPVIGPSVWLTNTYNGEGTCLTNGLQLNPGELPGLKKGIRSENVYGFFTYFGLKLCQNLEN